MPQPNTAFLPQATRLHQDGLDDEHQLLFALAKAGSDAPGQLDPDTALAQFDLFFEAIAAHFGHEELVMARLCYPLLQAHHLHHQRLLTRLEVLRGELVGHCRDIHEIWSDSATVVIEDVMSADLPFKTFLHEQGMLTGKEDKYS